MQKIKHPLIFCNLAGFFLEERSNTRIANEMESQYPLPDQCSKLFQYGHDACGGIMLILKKHNRTANRYVTDLGT